MKMTGRRTVGVRREVDKNFLKKDLHGAGWGRFRGLGKGMGRYSEKIQVGHEYSGEVGWKLRTENQI